MDEVVTKIVEFIRSIGISVRYDSITDEVALPGIRIERGGLVVDKDKLLYPGDILHEAGHLAVAPPEMRAEMDGVIDPKLDLQTAGELMTLPWTYAAALHIGIDPVIVFHSDGYKGGSQSILDNYAEGKYIGLPGLQWIGLTADIERAKELSIEPFPKMIQWVRK